MTDEQALAWFEGGIRLESAEQAGEAFRLAAAALRVKGQLVEALEVGCLRISKLAGTTYCLRCGWDVDDTREEALHRPETCEVAAALKAAKETP